MNPSTTNNWHEANQRYLIASLAVVRAQLERQAKQAHNQSSDEASQETSTDSLSKAQHALETVIAAMPASSALDQLCKTFNLSTFERDLLLLCIGMELDSRFPSLCDAAQNNSQRPYPTMSLALSLFPTSYWNALTPAAPLRRWQLIEVGSGATALTLSPLRIDERVLHYIAGVQHLDERLAGIVETLQVSPQTMVPSHRQLADQMAATWLQASAKGSGLPVVQLCGDEVASKRAIVFVACGLLNLNLNVMSLQAVPSNPNDLNNLIRIWNREAILSESALLLDCDQAETAEAVRENVITALIESINSPIAITTLDRQRSRQRPIITMDVHKPTAPEQRVIWQDALESTVESLNGHVEKLVSHFSLSAPTIYSVCAEALGQNKVKNGQLERNSELSHSQLPTLLWDTCRAQARQRLNDLAQPIPPGAGWDDLVLPEAQRQVLQDIAAHVQQRAKVYEQWGFGGKGGRGLGISALFAGGSGTGKTMAAEVIAQELRVDLYRIDLSSVVSKYIGETEKNLRRVFDAAETSGAILLFDEADALFGKRSEVKDSHDRHANIEVGYLLQRMESYRGLAVLTTNLKGSIDQAFLRRIRFIVQFPFPDATQRTEIWQRVFPKQTPTEGLDPAKLARLSVAGGNIRNIALNAAFIAADAGEPVGMKHVLQAAKSEYVKLERPLTDAEVKGWL